MMPKAFQLYREMKSLVAEISATKSLSAEEKAMAGPKLQKRLTELKNKFRSIQLSDRRTQISEAENEETAKTNEILEHLEAELDQL